MLQCYKAQTGKTQHSLEFFSLGGSKNMYIEVSCISTNFGVWGKIFTFSVHTLSGITSQFVVCFLSEILIHSNFIEANTVLSHIT